MSATALMQVIDAGDLGGCKGQAHHVRFECEMCGHRTEWVRVRSVAVAQRGRPCPKCSKTGETMKLEYAAQIAKSLKQLIVPYCQRVEIAGSIRRGKPDVSDIELVAVPLLQAKPGKLFEDGDRFSLLDRFLDMTTDASNVGQCGIARDHLRPPCWGPRSKRLRFEGMAVDLFIVLPPAEWGLIYFLRTGPADYSRLAVTQRGRGGWLPDSMCVVSGHIEQDGKPISTPDERDVFEILGKPYVDPAQRGVK